MATSLREGSNKVYEGKWSRFTKWRKEEQINPIQASLPEITSFLRYLRMEVGLSYSAILGYRSALNQIFILKGMNLADCKVISGLLRDFRNSCSPRDFAYPPWDLEIVLKYLRDQLEPISSISIRDLTLKTVFLVALDSARSM